MNKDAILDRLCEGYPVLSKVKKTIGNAAALLIDCYEGGGKLLVCGNGGSSSDSEHVVAELMKSFESARPLGKNFMKKLAGIGEERGRFLSRKLEYGFPAISLSSHTSLTTAICNDIDADLVFAQQVVGYGNEKDLLLGISTSGNSQNVIDACITAKALNMKVIGITGEEGGKMKQYCDVSVSVPAVKTAYIQELNLPVLHAICRIVEDHFYGNHN